MGKREGLEFILFVNGFVNGKYPILTHPEGSMDDAIEKLMAIKAGGCFWNYQEFYDRLKVLLTEITENEQLHDSESLNYFTQLKKNMTYRVEDGRLIEEWLNCKAYPIMLTPVVTSLINFLCDSKKLQRLRRCPICQQFFIAKDTKRFLCYERECKTKEDQYRKTYYRDMGWDEHGSISADNITLQDPLYKKLKEHWEVNNNKKKRNVR